jgi:hypothetical protein
MRFLGIEIERKTDILAMAAFLISAGSILGQTVLLLRGPQVIVDGPVQILLFFEKARGSRGFLNAISTQIYVNRGSPGYDDILKRESLALYLKGDRILLNALERVVSSRDGDILIINKRESWIPSKIRAGDFVSNETLYVPYPAMDSPRRDKHFVTQQQLMQLLPKSGQLKVVLSASTYAGAEIESSCYIDPIDIEVGLLNKGWASLVCTKRENNWLNSLVLRTRALLQ